MANKKCPTCGKQMKQQYPTLLHCSCGTSWLQGSYFQRTPDMAFGLRRVKAGKKFKQIPYIIYNVRTREETQNDLD